MERQKKKSSHLTVLWPWLMILFGIIGLTGSLYLHSRPIPKRVPFPKQAGPAPVAPLRSPAPKSYPSVRPVVASESISEDSLARPEPSSRPSYFHRSATSDSPIHFDQTQPMRELDQIESLDALSE